MVHYSTDLFTRPMLLVPEGSTIPRLQKYLWSSMFFGHREGGAWSAVDTGQGAGPAKPKIKAEKVMQGQLHARCPVGTSYTEGPQSTLVRCATVASSSVVWNSYTQLSENITKQRKRSDLNTEEHTPSR